MNQIILIPADVPSSAQNEFIKNYNAITNSTGKLMMFACDQKIEHLNEDFYGSFIHPDVKYPEHLFKIATLGKIGAMATQLGLIARYGKQYNNINYIVKLNSKTNLVESKYQDPISRQLWTVDDVIEFKKNSGLKICAVGYTIYLGSEFENQMLHEAAQIIFKAHQQGMVTLLWIYPRGKSIEYDSAPDLIAGAAGVANALGADFVKVKPPKNNLSLSSADALKIAIAAAGNTKVICSGGETIATDKFLKELYEQIYIGGTSGNATGRNIFQRSLSDAIAFTHAIAGIVYDQKTPEEALAIYESKI